ncbi:MAG: hypothetical protein JJ896_16760 [Rhodothermales bacterium]|nr:hypothetical protein [Rhodothermales bacterium]MBO6781310.1 hypothetical protein [Rhodothermales bacterium]
MRRFLPLLGVLAVLSSAVSAQPRVLGYHAWWMQDSWKDYDLELYDKLLFFEFSVDGTGAVHERHGWPDAWQPMIQAVHGAGGKVAPTFAILDPVVFSSVLGSADARGRLEETVMEMVRAGDADGAHLNFEVFEASTPAARAGFTQLVRRLRARLKDWRPDAELTVFLPGFDHGEAYDEVALADAADYLVVQGYDMHWLTAPTAGPVAPVRGWNGASWEGITARYAALGVDPADIVMAVPYFGYEWPVTGPASGASTRGEGVPITYATVSPDLLPLIRISALDRGRTHGVMRDPTTDSPYYTYQGADGWYQGWYEDDRSLDAKYRFVRERGLGGVAVFLLGYDGGLLEPGLRRTFGR